MSGGLASKPFRRRHWIRDFFKSSRATIMQRQMTHLVPLPDRPRRRTVLAKVHTHAIDNPCDPAECTEGITVRIRDTKRLVRHLGIDGDKNIDQLPLE